MLKKTSKIVALMLILVFAFAVVGCGGGDKEPAQDDAQKVEPITLHVASTTPPEHSYNRAADPWAKEIEEKTGGAIKPVLEFSGVHGGEREMVEMVMRGDLQMAWASDMSIAAVLPQLGYVNLPYLFKSYDEADSLYRKGWIGEEFAKVCEENGMVVLAFGENDFRGLTNSVRPINTGDDLKGLKLRVPETPMFLAFFKGLGTLPTPMAITEVATALQQKTVDGQDNGAIITSTFGFPAFQKYVTKTQHMYSAMEIIINKDLWDSFTPEQQQIVKEASLAAADNQVAMNRDDVDKFYQKMIDENGCEVQDRSPELAAAFQAAAEKTWNDPAVTDVYGDIMTRLKEQAGF